MYKLTILAIAAIFIGACSQSSYSSYKAEKNEDDSEVFSDNFSGTVEEQLAMLLRKTAGVQVFPTGNSYVVRVRGVSSTGQARPLFMIDGISMGTDFSVAASAIAGNRVKSVRVLKGQEASLYGTRGAGGVIIVKTEKPDFSSR